MMTKIHNMSIAFAAVGLKLTCGAILSVRVKGGMSLRSGMWHGLRNDIIMRNLIYAAE